MTTFEEMQRTGVSREVKNSRGSGWVIAHPIPSPFLRDRLRDAWAVWKGRAIAVRESTAEDMERLAQESC